jgi:DNA-binding MarR family transcriptional regulator
MRAHINSQHPSTELGRLFDHLHSMAADQVFTSMALAMHSVDLSFSQLGTIVQLYRHGALRIGELARALHLSPCATSRLVTRLVAEGLTEKRPNPDNKRERIVVLTREGRTYMERLQRSTATAYENLFCDVPPELKTQLLSTLMEVVPFLPQKFPC